MSALIAGAVLTVFVQTAPFAQQVDEWVEQLADPDIAVRDAATVRLMSLPRDVACALDLLAAETSEGPARAQRRLIEATAGLAGRRIRIALWSRNAFADPPMNPSRWTQIQSWIAQLRHETPVTRAAADERLSELARDFETVARALHKALESSDAEVRVRAEAISESVGVSDHPGERLVFPPQEFGERLAEAAEMIRSLETGCRGRERTYQRFLRYYEALRGYGCCGDPARLNQLDAFKDRAEQLCGGSQRLLRAARSLLEVVEESVASRKCDEGLAALRGMKDLRSRREFFQDENVVEMDKIIRAAEKRIAEARKRK